MHRPADELQSLVLEENPREQPRFAQDLKTVTDPQHRAALLGKAPDLAHHGREARDGTRPQVVAMGEPARKHNALGARQVGVPMPHQLGLGAQCPEGMHHVVFAVGAGEDNHRRPHAGAPRVISKSSITGLANNR